MMAWSIEAARQSGCFDRIIVSTDDSEIADVARNCEADVPFVRPAELSDDRIGTAAVILHAVEWMNRNGDLPREVCCIYATAPFLQPSDLQNGLEILRRTGADYAFSVTKFAFPIQRALRITPANRIEMFSPEHILSRSQDLEEAWHDAGQFYWGKTEAWMNNRPIFSAGSAPVILPRHRVLDIDTPEDWAEAELMFITLNRSEKIEFAGHRLPH